MRLYFYLQIEVPQGWRYLRRGIWNARTVFDEIPLIKAGDNLTEELATAQQWLRRGTTPSGRSSFDSVASSLACNFNVRQVMVRDGEILEQRSYSREY